VQYDSLLVKRYYLSGCARERHNTYISDQSHGVSLVHDETVFHANTIGSQTPRPQFPSPRAKVLRSWLQTSCRPSLRSPDGKESPRTAIRPGAQWDGYFTDSDIVLQCTSHRGDGYPSEALPPTMIISSPSTTPQLSSNGQIPGFLHGRCLMNTSKLPIVESG